MKKFFLFLLIALLCTSCSGKPADKPDKEKEEAADLKIEDYFPITENDRYVYGGTGNEYASYDVYTEYTTENKVQQRVDNGGTVTARVLENKDGRLTRLLSKGETYYRENMLDQKDGSEEILLMEPLKKGTAWTLKDGRKRTIVKIDSEVSTPSGTYSAIKVVTEGKNEDGSANSTTDYYAKNVGLVKTVYRSGDFEVISSLKKIDQDFPREEEIRFYFPDVNTDKMGFVDTKVSFRTNDSTGQILQKAYQEKVSDKYEVVFSENTKINNLRLDQDGRVRIDLNAAFLTEMNAGAAYESKILQSIANTLGRYYNTNEVILTVEGKPYESGHIRMEEGQSIKVDFSE